MKKIIILPAACLLAMSLFACAVKRQAPTSVPTSVPATPTTAASPTETPTPTEVPATPTPTEALQTGDDYDLWRRTFGDSVLFDKENNRFFMVTNDLSVVLFNPATQRRTKIASFADLRKEGAMDLVIDGLKDVNTLEVECIFLSSGDYQYADTLGATYGMQLYCVDIATGEITTGQTPGEVGRPRLVLNDDYVTEDHYAISNTGIKVNGVFNKTIIMKDRLIVVESTVDEHSITAYDLNSIYNKMGCEADAYNEFPPGSPYASREVIRINSIPYVAYSKYSGNLVIVKAEKTEISRDSGVFGEVAKNCRLSFLDGDLNEIASVKIADTIYNPSLYADEANQRIFISGGDTVYVYDCKTREVKQLAVFKHEGDNANILVMDIKDENNIMVWRSFYYSCDSDHDNRSAFYSININTGETIETEWRPENGNQTFKNPYNSPDLKPLEVTWDRENDKIFLFCIGELELEDYSSGYSLEGVYCDWKNGVIITSRPLNGTFSIYSCYSMATQKLISHCVIIKSSDNATIDESESKLFVVGQTDTKDNFNRTLFVWDYMRGRAFPLEYKQ